VILDHRSHVGQSGDTAAASRPPQNINFASTKHKLPTDKTEKMEQIIENLLESDTGYLLSGINEPNTPEVQSVFPQLKIRQ
jgi:hypothetical protein